MKRFFASAALLFSALFVLVPVPSQATTGYATALRNAQLDAITTYAGNGAKLQEYDGTRPATCGAISTQNKLAEWTMGSPFAPPASSGVLSPTFASSSTTGLGAGTATWWRLAKADGTTCVIDGSVGTSGADLNQSTTTVSSGLTLTISGWTITRGNP